ncbi:MAG: NAD(+)/NADH kinase [Dehalococcoidia bacterium]
MPPVGLLANPMSGKDIRRVIARASVFDNQEKQNIVRRAVAGAIAGGAREFAYMPDGYDIVSSAAEEHAGQATFTAVEFPDTNSALDTIRCARHLQEVGCGAVVTLGGDGTNRAFTLGWRDVPLIPVSTGTNNVFPRMVEATVAGAAAGLVASGRVPLAEVARSVKIVIAEIEGERDDLALIDAVVLNEQFIGARAIWDPSRLRSALLTRAEPAAVGISSIGGLLEPVHDDDEEGLAIQFGGADSVLAPIAPGLYLPVPVESYRRLPPGEILEVVGPGVLAFDGERERVLKPGQRATLRIKRDGPRVIDVPRTLQYAARRGHFRGTGEPHGS